MAPPIREVVFLLFFMCVFPLTAENNAKSNRGVFWIQIPKLVDPWIISASWIPIRMKRIQIWIRVTKKSGKLHKKTFCLLHLNNKLINITQKILVFSIIQYYS